MLLPVHFFAAALGVVFAISVQLLLTKRTLMALRKDAGSLHQHSVLRRRPRRPSRTHATGDSDDDDDWLASMAAAAEDELAPMAQPLPPTPPPMPPPLPPSPQPDELRQQSAGADVSVMRCGQPIPPESIHTTYDGDAAVTVFTRAKYQEYGEDELHAWTYDVEFVNVGKATVQLLTRHWVFVDADGKIEEIKGPGARGQLPVLKPGDKWSYESGTRLLTRRGAGKLPTTSVHSTERVIVGAISHVSEKNEDLHYYSFGIDVQVNNARTEPVTIVGIQWEIVDSRGKRITTSGHVGRGNDGGPASQHVVKLPPASALRLKASLPQIDTPTAKISGTLLVRFGDPDAALEAGAATIGDDDADYPREVVIAPLGASLDGEPVPPYEPLSFLDAIAG